MTTLFHEGEISAQKAWGTQSLWGEDRKQKLLWDHIPREFHTRLESLEFFFLATADAAGNCDCSFKGGGPGLIKILDERTFVFPDFPGNGAFMSLGNLLVNPQVGCLFIDFADSARLRVNGRASIEKNSFFTDQFPTVERVVRVAVELVVPNCSLHVPKLVKLVSVANDAV